MVLKTWDGQSIGDAYGKLPSTCLPTHIWVGPSDPKDVKKDFKEFFAHEASGGGDIFLGHSTDEELQVRIDMARNRGYAIPKGESSSDDRSCLDKLRGTDATKFLPPGKARTLQEYRKLWASNTKSWSSCIVDLSQSMERKRMGEHIPTLLTSTILYSVTADKFFTSKDLEAAHGFPVPHTPAWQKYQACLAYNQDQLDAFPPHVRRSMSGNSMHLNVAACWHAYILSHIVRRDEPKLRITWLHFLSGGRKGDQDREQAVKPNGPKRQASFQFQDIGTMFKRQRASEFCFQSV